MTRIFASTMIQTASMMTPRTETPNGKKVPTLISMPSIQIPKDKNSAVSGKVNNDKQTSEANYARTVIVSPLRREIFNSGQVVAHAPLPMETAPRVFLLIQNLGPARVYLSDSHWHNDLAVLEPGEQKVIQSAAILGHTIAGIGTVSMQLLYQ